MNVLAFIASPFAASAYPARLQAAFTGYDADDRSFDAPVAERTEPADRHSPEEAGHHPSTSFGRS